MTPLDMLVESADAKWLRIFPLSEAYQARFDALLERNRESTLSSEDIAW